ncbi:MAG TPA: phage portal protein [Solirubrobacterales bacterium]|nr:phage portal protein [Solirubrobacterales bacterium]
MSDLVRKAVRARVAPMPEGVTAQPEDNADRWTPEHALQPPADLDALAGFTQFARTRRSCIEAITLNTVGRGVEVVPREGMEDEAKEDEGAELLQALNDMARRDVRLQRPNLKRLLSTVKWDEEEVGNGYLEVSRNRVTGDIDGLFHVPGKLVRRREDRKGWVVGPKNGAPHEMVEFYDFGDKVQYSADGRPEARLAEGGPLQKRWDRNEIIAFQIYTSESRDYGLPRDAHLAIDYLGDRNAAEANVGFFGASGVPPTVIFVKVPLPKDDEEAVDLEIPPDVATRITQTLSGDGDKRHRVAVVALPEGVDADSIDLATLSERDMGFIEFRKDNRRATHGAFRLSPIFTADIEDTNYSTAETERRLTKEQVFDPEQDRWQDILAHTILRDMGAEHMTFKFAEIDVTDDKAQAEGADSLAEHEAITYGELRESHGLAPLPEAEEGQEPEVGEVEHGWNGMLVEVSGDASHGDILDGARKAALLLAEGNPTPTGIEE